jgi:CheY-like chemotaxis protein
MFNRSKILVVEDEPLVAVDLACAVVEFGGTVLGPVPSVAHALHLLETAVPDGAILDAILVDGEVTPLALALLAQGVPFVVHTGTGLPPALAELAPGTPVLMKPVSSDEVARVLAATLDRRSPNAGCSGPQRA